MTERLYRYRYPTGGTSVYYESQTELDKEWGRLNGALETADLVWVADDRPWQETQHGECDCVPDLGPSHCHLCGDELGQPVTWDTAQKRHSASGFPTEVRNT